ncbi:MAG: phytanoyl-CoA dioxygenase family protein [Myxococcales bacterium]|nr:phytanoyl-CoA dioxygenase family protein [Myxococcales bacterium]
MKLSPTQVSEFSDQGFLIVRGLLAPAALQPLILELTREVDQYIEEAVARGLLARSDTFPSEPFERRLALVARACADPKFFVRRLYGKQHKTAGMFALRTWPALLDVVESLIGPEIFAHPMTMLRPKLPDVAAVNLPWHQDIAYLLEDAAGEATLVNCWIPLVDARADNGCLQVVAGSHRARRLPHDERVDQWIGISDEQFPAGQVVTCELAPGDVLLIGEQLVHRSLPHRSDAVRWSLDTRYCRVGAPTGRDHKPGFIARSRRAPERVARSHHDWIRAFEEAGLDWTERTWKGLSAELHARAVRVLPDDWELTEES